MKFPIPDFISDPGARERYERWVKGKARALWRHDKRKYGRVPSVGTYEKKIQECIARSRGIDSYTGENLRWDLVGKFDSGSAKAGGFEYHRSFALLPTIDHRIPGAHSLDFEVCAWRTNDAKSALTPAEFLELCKRVVAYAANTRLTR